MRIIPVVLTLIGLYASYSYACFTGSSAQHPLTGTAKRLAHKMWRKNSKPGRKLASDLSSVPWGGEQAGWSNEAVLANAVSAALNDGWAMADVQDVLVSVPLKMIPGKVPNPADKPDFVVNRPYGDGQTNAHMSFGEGWGEKQPELVTTLIQFKSNSPLLRFRFHFDKPQSINSIEINFQATTGNLVRSISGGTKLAGGDVQFDWKPASGENPLWGTLFENKVAFVRVAKASTWFPIDFRNVMLSEADLLNSVPEAMRGYGHGLVDPEDVRTKAEANHGIPYSVMDPDNFGSDLRAERYFPVHPPGIHSGFYDDSGNRFDTAVGDGDTTLLKSTQDGGTAPMKMAYICFKARDPLAEATAHAPSGGGWHEIGDPAETVINSLENASVIFGYANGMPAAKTPDGTFDHGLTDVAVIRRVPPGYGIVTASGPTSISEEKSNWNYRGHDPANQRNYHWFIFDQPNEVCAVEWVHKCVPTSTNQLGMGC